jgi:hypothetical protein
MRRLLHQSGIRRSHLRLDRLRLPARLKFPLACVVNGRCRHWQFTQSLRRARWRSAIPSRQYVLPAPARARRAASRPASCACRLAPLSIDGSELAGIGWTRNQAGGDADGDIAAPTVRTLLDLHTATRQRAPVGARREKLRASSAIEGLIGIKRGAIRRTNYGTCCTCGTRTDSDVTRRTTHDSCAGDSATLTGRTPPARRHKRDEGCCHHASGLHLNAH